MMAPIRMQMVVKAGLTDADNSRMLILYELIRSEIIAIDHIISILFYNWLVSMGKEPDNNDLNDSHNEQEGKKKIIKKFPFKNSILPKNN